ncbi:MAG: molybdopterin molybdotransferase MoeA [archaeon GBS-70-058]|nr:molybdopterin molybdotransferase MoeA [Candidatus Culexarchaeum nevadense]
MSILSSFKTLTKVDEALKLIDERVTYKVEGYEEIEISEAVNRICYEDIISPINVPPFTRAAMDGYAVKAEDTTSASIKNPIILKVIGCIDVGRTPEIELKPGCAIEISTGAPIPKGADAVIPYEETKRINGYIEVYSQVHPWKNVSLMGEDIKVGDIILKKGTIIKPWDIAVLVSVNILKVKVLRKPIIGVLSTGSEIIEPGGSIEEGKIWNSTKVMLKAMILEDYGVPLDLGVVEDDEDKICEKIMNALPKCDIIITTGGTSIGRSDKTVSAIRRIGGEIIFHGVSMRPGKPTAMAIVKGKPIVMLSGFPVAALTGYQNFVRRVMERICGIKFPPQPKIKARMDRRIASQLGSREYLRVKVLKKNGEYIAIPLRLTGSGLLSSITQATGIVVIPENVEGYEEGDIVEVTLLRGVDEY